MVRNYLKCFLYVRAFLGSKSEEGGELPSSVGGEGRVQLEEHLDTLVAVRRALQQMNDLRAVPQEVTLALAGFLEEDFLTLRDFLERC